MSVVSITLDIVQIRNQERKLRSMVHTHETVQVLRNGKLEEIFSEMVIQIIILIFFNRILK